MFWDSFGKCAGLKEKAIGAAAGTAIGAGVGATANAFSHGDLVRHFSNKAKDEGLKAGSKEHKEYVNKKVKRHKKLVTGITAATYGGAGLLTGSALGHNPKGLRHGLKPTNIESVVMHKGKKYFINPKGGNA